MSLFVGTNTTHLLISSAVLHQIYYIISTAAHTTPAIVRGQSLRLLQTPYLSSLFLLLLF